MSGAKARHHSFTSIFFCVSSAVTEVCGASEISHWGWSHATKAGVCGVWPVAPPPVGRRVGEDEEEEEEGDTKNGKWAYVSRRKRSIGECRPFTSMPRKTPRAMWTCHWVSASKATRAAGEEEIGVKNTLGHLDGDIHGEEASLDAGCKEGFFSSISLCFTSRGFSSFFSSSSSSEEEEEGEREEDEGK